MQEKMTFVLTSCGRIDLIDKTLESFFIHNTFKFDELFWLKIQLMRMYIVMLEKMG